MKIKNITLSNFSKYDQVDVSFDDSVTYLVGKNGSGKSTLGITAIWFMFQGIAEKASGGNSPLIGERFRFIGPKAATAKGEMTLYDEKTMAEIRVMRKLTKTGTDLSFEGPEGLELGQKWLTDLFNVFLIAPKMFCELSPKDQAKALGIDTKSFDDTIATLKKKYTEINAVYNSYGELLEVEKVEKEDMEVLAAEKKAIAIKLNNLYLENKEANKATKAAWEAEKKKIDLRVTEDNKAVETDEKTRSTVQQAMLDIAKIVNSIPGLEDLVNYTALSDLIANWEPLPQKVKAEDLYPAEPTNLADMAEDYQPHEFEKVYIREMPAPAEMTAIDLRIAEAGKVNEKALLYTQYLEKKIEKDKRKVELSDNKLAQTSAEESRIRYIKAFKFPFSNLTVGEDGELLLQGKPIKEPYFSTGEILKVVPILLSTSNPDLKYVFLQDFNLMDEDKQSEIETYLTDKGFQLVVEIVGKKKIEDKNCILLRDNIVVEDYAESAQPALNL